MEGIFNFIAIIMVAFAIAAAVVPKRFLQGKDNESVERKSVVFGMLIFAGMAFSAAALIPESAEVVVDESTQEQEDDVVALQGEGQSGIDDKDQCIDISDKAVNRIADGLNTEGISLRGAQAVIAPNRENAYFVTVDLQGPGLEGVGDIAVLATNDLELGSVISVDAVANEFFVWPDGRSSDFNFSVSEAGVGGARECTRAKLSE